MPCTASDLLEQASNIYMRSIEAAYSVTDTIDAINRIKYPLIRVHIEQYDLVRNPSYAYGILKKPGIYEITISQVNTFAKYYLEQITLMTTNQKCTVTVSESIHNIPLTFIHESLVEKFQVHNTKKLLPDLQRISYFDTEHHPLGLFHAYRVDHSVKRLEHYTKTKISEFQEYIILVNYTMYINAFKKLFGQGNYTESSSEFTQMYAVHSPKYNISVINIGVGPSNAKNITDHLSVLRSKLWVMLGHCAGLNEYQEIGDYVLAQDYIREDALMDSILPKWIPIPKIQPIEKVISNICEQTIHFGTVISTGDRNWEMNIEYMKTIINQSNAVGLEMESATIACNAFVNKIPYITFLCISDIPILGVLKLPHMAQDFYQAKIPEHSIIIFEAIKIIQTLSIHEQLKYIRNASTPPWR